MLVYSWSFIPKDAAYRWDLFYEPGYKDIQQLIIENGKESYTLATLL